MPTDLEYLTTKELAELLRIKERKVYDLAAAGEVPCSRATGKLLFPRQAVDAWIASRSSGPALQVNTAPRPAIFLGSHDPLLEWALRESRAGLATHFDSSLDGLERFAAGAGVATGLHVPGPEPDTWNSPLISQRYCGQPVVLVEFAWRERGLIVQAGAEKKFHDMDALQGRCLIPRQPEAGSQVLLERLLRDAGLSDTVRFGAVARSEADAALAVLTGKGDAAFGLRELAHQHGLGFVPLQRERFDLLIDRRAWFEPPLQSFLGFCSGESFAAKAAEMHGYDVTNFGRIKYNG